MRIVEKFLAIVSFKSSKEESIEVTLKEIPESKQESVVESTQETLSTTPIEQQVQIENSSNSESDIQAENLDAEVKTEQIMDQNVESKGDSIQPTHEENQITLEPVVKSPNKQWFAQYEAVVGLNHRKVEIPLPCQDSAVAFTSPKPTIIIADGAGSSAVSDLGSKAVVSGLARFIKTLGNQFSDLLDKESSKEKQQEIALILVKHAKGILEDLAQEHRRPMKDFRCTLLLAIVGEVHTLWVKVGDGALAIERAKKNGEEMISELSTLGEVGKGEYANVTTFIDENVKPDDVQNGVLASQHITALFAMSDGSAEKFVSTKSDKVATRLTTWAELLRQDRLARSQLTKSFYAEDFLNGHTGDDCSIAMISAKLS